MDTFFLMKGPGSEQTEGHSKNLFNDINTFEIIMTDIEAISLKARGDESFQKGNYQDAIRYYLEAVQLDPQYLQAWNNMEDSYSKLGLKEESLQVKNKIEQIQSGGTPTIEIFHAPEKVINSPPSQNITQTESKGITIKKEDKTKSRSDGTPITHKIVSLIIASLAWIILTLVLTFILIAVFKEPYLTPLFFVISGLIVLLGLIYYWTKGGFLYKPKVTETKEASVDKIEYSYFDYIIAGFFAALAFFGGGLYPAIVMAALVLAVIYAMKKLRHK